MSVLARIERYTPTLPRIEARFVNYPRAASLSWANNARTMCIEGEGVLA